MGTITTIGGAILTEMLTPREDDDGEVYYILDGLDLVLCRDPGNGRWSLHSPKWTNEEIVFGGAPSLASGEAERDEMTGLWNRPDEADYKAAFARAVT